MNRGVHISRESGYTQAEIIALIRGELEKQNDKNFPIGYIWMSTADTDPSTIVGGTWERIQDTFLLAAGANHSAGSTGGAETHAHTTGNHTLAVGEIPSHTHGTNSTTHTTFVLARGGEEYAVERKGFTTGSTNYAYANTTNSNANLARLGTTGSTGGGLAHNHGDTGSSSSMPPYLAVYMWKRTA